MSKDSTRSFKDAFGEFLKEEHLDVKFRQEQLINSWERIMGRPIASRTTNMYFRDKTLFVELSSAALKQELNNSKAAIIARIEEQMGKMPLTDIRFI